MPKYLFYMHKLGNGGAERTLLNLLNHFQPQGNALVLALHANEQNDYVHELPAHIKIHLLRGGKLSRLWQLHHVLQIEKPDLVFTNVLWDTQRYALLNLLTGRKTRHIAREISPPSLVCPPTRRHKWLVWLTYQHLVHQIIAPSQAIQRDLVETFGISAEKIHVIHNPVDIAHIQRAQNEPIPNLVRRNGEKIIVTVSRLAPEKELSTLLRAFQQVCQSVPAQLLILGRGPLQESLQNDAHQLGIAGQVHFLGFQQNPYKYIHSADVLALSSTYEGFGNVIVEAMACGTPVVATDCPGGPREILGDSQYGLLSPVGDSARLAENLINILSDSQKAQNLHRRGLERVRDFDAMQQIQRFANLLTPSMSRIQYPIKDLVPEIWLTTFGESDFFTYNPSIVNYNGQNIMAYRVSTRDFGLNQSATCLLDDRWRLIPDTPRPLFVPQKPDAPEQVEDVRLFEHAGNLWAIFNDSKRPNLLYLAQIDPVSRQATGRPRPLLLNERNILEKNWMPFSHAGQMWVLYSIYPHIVLRLDLNDPNVVQCERVSAIDWDDEGINQQFGPWHGGNAPTLHDGLFWVFPHMVAQTSFLGDLTAPLRKWIKRHKKSALVTFADGDVRSQQQPFAEWFPRQTRLSAYKIWLARLKRHVLFRHYVLGVYAFEARPPFIPRFFSYRPILRASQEQAQHREPLILDRPQVVFAAGAIIQADGAWQVSYGLHDDFCIIRAFSPEYLLHHCRPVKILAPNDILDTNAS